ncbi:MAG: hypothetical protein H6696_01825 [Deferribacteres bacterium]|nr:hypothetical protein [candidate division KSB1 bacterium]MCB9500650.1 hypothetical protein [Deferribacteres bacterium]
MIPESAIQKIIITHLSSKQDRSDSLEGILFASFDKVYGLVENIIIEGVGVLKSDGLLREIEKEEAHLFQLTEDEKQINAYFQNGFDL